MRDVLGPGTILGYCTNVHPAMRLNESIHNVEHYCKAIKLRVSPEEDFGFGWWLSQRSVQSMLRVDDLLRHQAEMWRESGLVPFTFNGFPQGDFHQNRVKHAVYQPDWSTPDRLAYTRDLTTLHVMWSAAGDERSISTLPLGWPGTPCPPVKRLAAVNQILELVHVLHRAQVSSAVLVHCDLEPEPGCILQRTADVTGLFADGLLYATPAHGLNESVIKDHIRVCHDICHAAVMFEDQAQVLQRYRSAGIKVGKVQISNAIRVPFDEYSESERREALQQLRAFAEDRYLHQTMIRMSDGEMRFFEDLPLALASVTDGQTARGEWRVHFHVPVFLERFGLIQTTQREIRQCLTAIERDDQTNHYEIETYAWNVLPQELRTDDLVDGIARELLWVKELARELKK